MSNELEKISRREFLELSAAGVALMALSPPSTLQSALGRGEVDSSGSPVGVARMEPERSYAGVPELLQRHLNGSDPEAWNAITAKIDYTYESLDLVLAPLEAATGFAQKMKARLARGERLLFKPNLVVASCIDPVTHGPHIGSATCTEWPFMAALMRWFHDRLGVSYYQMAVGEAATTMPAYAAFATSLHPARERVTPEGLIEGKTGDLYFGWGFYFARRYLAERLPSGSTEDPMRGYEESVRGTYIAPGEAGNRLMVYDLNRIRNEIGNGREIPVPQGVNYRRITVHKAIVGGDPANAADRKAYPGSILINVPKLKVHSIALLTNAIKNLGIGLYPMQADKRGGTDWAYSSPRNPFPGMKEPIPHQVWVPEVDQASGLARRDEQGNYAVRRTGGLRATMIDIVEAVVAQGIFMLHVVDGIEAINHDHTGPGDKVPEGMVLAGLDPVATDLLSARYLFCNVPLSDVRKAGIKDRSGGYFPQAVPLPSVENGSIVTRTGYDCPLARDFTFEDAEKRGLGQQRYYVVGGDAKSGRPLVSIEGHLGLQRQDDRFAEIRTHTLYFAHQKVPWDLQRTSLAYLRAADELTGSSWTKAFLDAFDENGDGVVAYDEFGKKGSMHPMGYMIGFAGSMMARGPEARRRAQVCLEASALRNTRREWNAEGHDLFANDRYAQACLLAYGLSQQEEEAKDPIRPSITYGGGKWPSFEFAREQALRNSVQQLYAAAVAYADIRLNEGRLTGKESLPDPAPIEAYVRDVREGRLEPLRFTIFVPPGTRESLADDAPNVEETEDPGKIFTFRLAEAAEILPGAKPFVIT